MYKVDLESFLHAIWSVLLNFRLSVLYVAYWLLSPSYFRCQVDRISTFIDIFLPDIFPFIFLQTRFFFASKEDAIMKWAWVKFEWNLKVMMMNELMSYCWNGWNWIATKICESAWCETITVYVLLENRPSKFFILHKCVRLMEREKKCRKWYRSNNSPFFFGVHFHFIDDEISSISIRNRFYILEKHFVVLNTAVPFILRLPFNASPPDDCYRGCQKQRTHRQVLRTETNSKNKNRTDTQKHTATNVAKQIAC